jgi:hypothetical protein
LWALYEVVGKGEHLNPGDIFRVKISGETVIVVDAGLPVGIKVRRAMITRDGIEYEPALFAAYELEPVEANIDREFREAVYRTNLFRSGLVVQQQELAQSADDQGELFEDEDPEEPLN